MSLSSGSRLGVYEIVGRLGVGGMGEVYRARDTKLGREVAIKILPEHFSQDAERLARFEREAKLLAALNHPGIATLYGLEESKGSPFLVMELVEGETLAARIARGAIALDEALSLFKQIADALEAAHDKGIIHRDLKPANIMITPDGNVKVLDFGLAKAFAGDNGPVGNGSQSPTLTKGMALGAILGTASYMSPEQARGKPVDKRTDVWAFGCCLYEALAGRKAFEGETATDTISAVVRAEPAWDRLPTNTPAALRKLLRRALTKARNDRLADVADARLEIQEALARPDTHAEPPGGGRRFSVYVAVASLAGIIVGLSVWSLMRPTPQPTTRLAISLPEGQRLVDRRSVPIALSPDGRRLVYAAETDEGSQLYLRELDSFQSTPIAGTEGGHTPFFSPDGSSIGFFTNESLKRVSLDGGVLTTLAAVQSTSSGGSWTQGGTIVYVAQAGSVGGAGLMQVPQGGGTPTRLTEAGVSPQVLSDGHTILYTLLRGLPVGVPALISVDTGEGTVLDVVVEGSDLAYSPTGHLLYRSASNAVVALPMASDREVGEEASTVLTGVVTRRDSPPYLTISSSGTLAYVSGGGSHKRLVIVDRDGRAAPLVEHAALHMPRFSPDGTLLAYDTSPGLWIYDLAREASTRLTVERETGVAWSPDGSRVLFASNGRLYSMPSDGSREAEPLSAPTIGAELSWSVDGRLLTFTQNNDQTGRDVWVFAVGEEPAPFLVTSAEERAPRFSPDGRFIVYMSDEAGRNEIYARPFPGPGGKWNISADGGTEPIWSRDGKEIFYRSGRELMVVDVEATHSLVVGKPRVLFSGDFLLDISCHPGYDVSPDGQSFVMMEDARNNRLTEIHIVLNWFDELERLVPTH